MNLFLQASNNIAGNFAVSIPMRLFKATVLCFTLLAMFYTSGCRKDKLFTGKTNLQISADTVLFDTVFTREPGTTYPISVTRIFSVRNTEKQAIKVSFKLQGGKNSPYRINVDGHAGPEINDVEILAKDSVFVFVQCSLDANNKTQPMLVLDSIISTVNGNSQKTILAAYGWDAHYFHSVILPCNEVWADKVKPYVIVDNVLVESGCTFTIKEGVSVFSSPRSYIIAEGTLKFEGTAAEPINLTGDIPLFAAKYLPGQWQGIYLTVGSANNSIKYTNILNASLGIRVDSLPVGGLKNLVLENTSIMFCSQACLAGVTAVIDATNCLFAQTGTYSFLGLLGGTYNFKHCTFADYSGFAVRQQGHFAVTNTLRNSNGFILRSEPLNCTVLNSIIYGSQTEELFLDSGGSAAFNTNFDKNLIKSQFKPFSNSTYNKDPLFADMAKHLFSLQTTSPAKDAGKNLIPPILKDLLDKPRDSSPDLGAYEVQ